MDKLVELLFSPLGSEKEDTIHRAAELEKEVLEFRKRWYHSTVVGDSSPEGRRLIYMKLLGVADDNSKSLLYPQGLAVEDFAPGCYTSRPAQPDLAEMTFLITYTISGEGLLRYEGRKYKLSAGDGFVIDCQKPHRYECLGERWQYVLVHFSGAAAHTYLRHIEDAEAIKFSFAADSLFTMAFKRLFSLYIKEQKMQDIQAALLITDMLTHILMRAESHSSVTGVSSDMLAVQRYISENYAENISLDFLAAQFNMSKYRLAHAFKESLGISPIDYLLSVRLERAKDLLLHSNFSLTDICQTIGISGTNHFYYLFKKRFNISPSQYRQGQR